MWSTNTFQQEATDQITQYTPDPDNMEYVYHTVWVLYNVEDPYFVATLFFTFKHKKVNAYSKYHYTF